MSTVWTLSGWACAAAATATATLVAARLRTSSARVARAVHELRGGLCAAQLGLEAMLGPAGGDTLAAVDLQLRRAGRALADLDGDGRPSCGAQAVDARAVLREVVAAWAPPDSVEVTLADAPAYVGMDRICLAQALGNLVANALEHGAAPVTAAVSSNAGLVRIEICDAGPGLPATVAELVAAARRRCARRGHGLVIAHDAVTRAGGTLISAPCTRGVRLVAELPERAVP